MKKYIRDGSGGLDRDAFSWLYDVGLRETMLILDHEYVKDTNFDWDNSIFGWDWT